MRFQKGNTYGRANAGENNGMWKGDSIDNTMGKAFSLHRYVQKRIQKPKICPICNIRPVYDLANITGIYNRELNNWQYQCRGCHMRSDGRLNNLKQYNR